jgi:hypothetical protein
MIEKRQQKCKISVSAQVSVDRSLLGLCVIRVLRGKNQQMISINREVLSLY